MSRRGVYFVFLFWVVAVFLFSNLTAQGQLPSQGLLLLSGVREGSYHQLADDIQDVTSQELNILFSKGSVDNYNQLITRTNVKMAFMQFDVLIAKQMQDYEQGTNHVSNLRVLLPMGLEEIHLITRSDLKINSLQDLKKKKVAIGTPLQGTFVTATTIKELTKISWNNIPLSFSQSLTSLLQGTIDAFFFVGAVPVEKLDKLPAQSKTKIKLVPILHSSLDPVYAKTVIKKSRYKWLDQDVETYAVKSVLVANVFRESEAEQKRTYEILSDIFTHINELKSEGHLAWKQVDFNFNGMEWPKYDGVEQIFKK